MVITLARTPRGSVPDVYNLCVNPSFEVDTSGWTFLWSGDGGATATDARLATGFANKGGYVLSKTWTKAPTTTAVMAGFQYAAAWPAGETRSIAASMQTNGHSLPATIQIDFLNGAGAVVGQQTAPTRTLAAGGWTLFSFQNVTAPAGTVSANIKFGLAAGTLPAINDQLWLDAVMVNYGSTALPYFDGSTAPSGVYTYGWWGNTGTSQSTRYIPDPATLLAPDMVMGYDTGRQSRNTVHQFLSGTVGATQLPSSLRSGTLRLFFQDPAAAANAEKVHAGAGFFTFTDDANPAEGMTYVVNGSLRSYQDATRLRRILEIPYAEITP